MLGEQTLAAIGRMTVAATDLELFLSWIGDPATPGGDPLGAARTPVRPDLIAYVEAAGTQLAQSRAAVRVLWQEGSRRDAAMFDEITDRLVRLRDILGDLVPQAS